MERKGVVYTLFAVFVMMTFAPMLFYMNSESQRNSDEMISKLRSDELYFFTTDLRKDIERSIIISTKRAIIATTSHIISSGNCVTDVPETFTETIFNGTINSTHSEILNGSTLDSWIENVMYISHDIGIESNVTVYSVLFNSSVDPFMLNMSSDVNFIVSDKTVDITFNRSYDINQQLSIDEFEDPYLSLQSNGYLIRKFSQCAHSERLGLVDTGDSHNFIQNFTSGYVTTDINHPEAVDRILVAGNRDGLAVDDLNSFKALVFEEDIDTSDLIQPVIESVSTALVNAQDNDYFVLLNSSGAVWFNNIYPEIESKCYFEDMDAPSFLDRFECSSSLSSKYNVTSQGVATFVDLRLLPLAMRFNRTAIDHLYFSGYSGEMNRLMGVSNELSWFMLDNNHITSMGAQSLVY